MATEPKSKEPSYDYSPEFSQDQQKQASGLARKLLAVMNDIEAVEKTGHNTFFNYDYQKASEVAKAVRQSLVKHGVWQSTTMLARKDYDFQQADGKTVHGADVTCRIVFEDVDTGRTSLPCEAYGSAFDFGDKAISKAQTMALKYALKAAFLIPDEADAEADESVDRSTGAKPPAAKPTASAPRAAQPASTSGIQYNEVSDNAAQIRVADVIEKKSQSGKTYWEVVVNGKSGVTTWDSAIAPALLEAKGELLDVEIKKKGDWVNVVSILSPIGQDRTAARKGEKTVADVKKQYTNPPQPEPPPAKQTRTERQPTTRRGGQAFGRAAEAEPEAEFEATDEDVPF
jgi:hypothetical protein